MFFTGDVHKSYHLPSREDVLKALKDIKEVCLWFQHKGGCEECYFSHQEVGDEVFNPYQKYTPQEVKIYECQLRRWKPCDMRLNEADDEWKAIVEM